MPRACQACVQEYLMHGSTEEQTCRYEGFISATRKYNLTPATLILGAECPRRWGALFPLLFPLPSLIFVDHPLPCSSSSPCFSSPRTSSMSLATATSGGSTLAGDATRSHDHQWGDPELRNARMLCHSHQSVPRPRVAEKISTSAGDSQDSMHADAVLGQY